MRVAQDRIHAPLSLRHLLPAVQQRPLHVSGVVLLAGVVTETLLRLVTARHLSGVSLGIRMLFLILGSISMRSTCSWPQLRQTSCSASWLHRRLEQR